MVPCPAPQHGDRPPVPRPRYAAAVTEPAVTDPAVTDPAVTDPAVTDLNDRATDPFAVADAAATVIRERTGADRHDVALVLGSGWRDSADLIGETLATIDNTDVPGFGRAAVAGHSGVMRSVSIGDTGRRALVYGTRTHYYEGEGVRPVVHGIRTAAAAGCTRVGAEGVGTGRHAAAQPRPRGTCRPCWRSPW